MSPISGIYRSQDLRSQITSLFSIFFVISYLLSLLDLGSIKIAEVFNLSFVIWRG